MVRLRLVKTVVEEEANSVREYEYGLLHGTEVLLELVESWANTDRFFEVVFTSHWLEQQRL